MILGYGVVVLSNGCAFNDMCKKVGKMADVYSGAGSNITQYVKTATQDKLDWHNKLIGAWNYFWPKITGAVAIAGVVFRKQVMVYIADKLEKHRTKKKECRK